MSFVYLRTRATLQAALTNPRVTHYGALGVSPGALEDENLHMAKREVLSLFHPDRNPGLQNASDLCARATLAYSVLSDSAERARYDASLRSTHEPCPVCAGAGFRVKQRGFTKVDRLRCLGCDGEGWIAKTWMPPKGKGRS